MTMADVTERLMAEFEDRLSLTRIVSVVVECRRELQRRPTTAEPAPVERLARQRLLDAIVAPDVPAPRPAAPLYLT